MPENICLNCVQSLNNVVSFRKLCERSDETLRLWLATSQEQIANSQKDEFFVCADYLAKKEEESTSDFSVRGFVFRIKKKQQNIIRLKLSGFSSSKESKGCNQFEEETHFESVDEEFVDVFNAG